MAGCGCTNGAWWYHVDTRVLIKSATSVMPNALVFVVDLTGTQVECCRSRKPAGFFINNMFIVKKKHGRYKTSHFLFVLEKLI